jgi:hypothetical protein
LAGLKSQLRLAGNLLRLVDTQAFPQTERQSWNWIWQVAKQDCATLFFGMGVKLPAKLVVTEVNRITAATVSFMYASIKGVEWVILQEV